MRVIFPESSYEPVIIGLFGFIGYTHLYAPNLDRNYEDLLLDDFVDLTDV